jgi:hypothetical protein
MSKANAEKKYVFHTDPGHGWLAVKMAELHRLGIAGQITRFSYMRGQTAYLEEDCDLTTFIKAKIAAKEGYQIDERSTNRLSPVRSYMSYSALVLK